MMLYVLLLEFSVGEQCIEENGDGADGIVHETVSWKDGAMHGIMHCYEKASEKKGHPNSPYGNGPNGNRIYIDGYQVYETDAE